MKDIRTNYTINVEESILILVLFAKNKKLVGRPSNQILLIFDTGVFLGHPVAEDQIMILSLQDLFLYEELLNENKAIDISSKAAEECISTSFITSLVSSSYLEAEAGKSNWLRLMLSDAIYSMLLVLFERLIGSSIPENTVAEKIAKLGWQILDNVIMCHKNIK